MKRLLVMVLLCGLIAACGDDDVDLLPDAAPVDASLPPPPLPDAAVPDAGCEAPKIEVLTNGDFDGEPLGDAWVLEPGTGPTPLIAAAGDVNSEADTPPNVAALGGYNAADTIPAIERDSSAMGQTNLVIPTDGSATLSFFLDVATQENPLGAPFDFVDVLVTDAAGNGPVLRQLNNLDDDGVVQLAVPEGSFTNVVFRVSIDDSLITLFIVDTVSLTYPGECL